MKWLQRLTYGEGKLFAKGDQESNMGQIAQQRTTASNNQQTATNNAAARIGTPASTGANGVTTPATGLLGQQSNQLDAVTKGYNNFAGTGGVSDQATQALGTGPGSIAGGVAAPDYSLANAGYGQIAATGGVNLSGDQSTFSSLQQPNGTNNNIVNNLSDISTGTPTASTVGGVNNSISALNNFAATGGVDQATLDQLNSPLYNEYEQTGGYSDQDIANITKQSNSVIPSYYSSLQDQLKRTQAAQGYGPGFSDAAQAAVRQGAVDSGSQALSTGINIQNAIRQGKMSAAQQNSADALGLIQYTTPAKEAALAAAGQQGLGLLGQETGAEESAGSLNSQQQQIMIAAASGDVNAQKIIQSGQLAGLGGLSSNITSANNAALNTATLASNNEKSLSSQQQQGEEFGTSGLGSLYNSTTNQLSDEEKNYLTSLGMSATQQQQLLSLLVNEGSQQGSTSQGFSNLFKGVGAGVGALTGLGG